MRPHFSKRDKLILGGGAIFVILLIVIAQFLMLSPSKSDLAAKQQELTNEQNLLDIVSKKKTETKTVTSEDTKELQMKVPVKPLEDQFILDLEKAETVSNSLIKSMSFSQDADVTVATNQASPGSTNAAQNQSAAQTTTNTSTTTQNSTSTSVTNSTAPNQAQSNQGAVPAPPTGMKKLTVNLSVQSPNYEGFEKFVGTLESLKRIVVVESINYSGPPEITSLGQDSQPFTFSLTISTFYMPGLTDLQAQLPKIDAPAPAHKDNPLSGFADITK